MLKARIYSPARNAMQQGRTKTGNWILEFEPARALRPDTLMGWAGGGDTNRQVRLKFDSVEAATAYAKKHGIAYEVEAAKARVVKPKSYADNFRWDRQA
jgi:hypothetical protein